jgi:hypothetical protein
MGGMVSGLMGGMGAGFMGMLGGKPNIPQPASAPPPPTPQAPQVQKTATDEMQLRAGMGRASTLLTQPDENNTLGKDASMRATTSLGM